MLLLLRACCNLALSLYNLYLFLLQVTLSMKVALKRKQLYAEQVLNKKHKKP